MFGSATNDESPSDGVVGRRERVHGARGNLDHGPRLESGMGSRIHLMKDGHRLLPDDCLLRAGVGSLPKGRLLFQLERQRQRPNRSRATLREQDVIPSAREQRMICDLQLGRPDGRREHEASDEHDDSTDTHPEEWHQQSEQPPVDPASQQVETGPHRQHHQHGVPEEGEQPKAHQRPVFRAFNRQPIAQHRAG